MANIRVGVLRGGPSSEYDVSLRTGASVLEHLPERYDRTDILIDRDGKWHMNGLPVSPDRVFARHDVIVNALHGVYGEDGKIQQMMDSRGVRYGGSGALASAITMNKQLAKRHLAQAGIRTPHGVVFTRSMGETPTIAHAVYKKIAPGWFVKPVSGGSSIGVGRANTFPELLIALDVAFSQSDQIIVEELLRGREATCGVLEDFRGQGVYATPPVEIISSAKGGFYSYEDKYCNEARVICPGNFTGKEKEDLENIAKQVHVALGLSHYSRTDFIINKRGIFVLETNSLPCLSEAASFSQALSSIGCSHAQFLHHLVGLALAKK